MVCAPVKVLLDSFGKRVCFKQSKVHLDSSVMASVRRALSLVPRPGNKINKEAYSVASLLSKVRTFVLGLLSQRSSRSLERLKLKGRNWRRALLQLVTCFVLGVFIGLTPFVSLNLSAKVTSIHRDFSIEVLRPYENDHLDDDMFTDMISSFMNSSSTFVHSEEKHERQAFSNGNHHLHEDVFTNMTSSSAFLDNSRSEPSLAHIEVKDEVVINGSRKLLIIVTQTEPGLFQAYNLHRLIHTLKLVPPPLLWIVVEMDVQLVETADILRRSGVIYRHIMCKENSTEENDRNVLLRNAALDHIETHRLDGIVYFADDYNVYALDVFEQMRQISQFGTWVVARLAEDNREVILQGPICNGSQVIGWHTDGKEQRSQRFYAEMSGFAFNSTVLWDPTLKHIRQLDLVKAVSQASTFIEQVVEDESQMVGLPMHCSRIMVWQFDRESLYRYTRE